MKQEFSVQKNASGFYCLRDQNTDLIATFALHVQADSEAVKLISSAPYLLEALEDAVIQLRSVVNSINVGGKIPVYFLDKNIIEYQKIINSIKSNNNETGR